MDRTDDTDNVTITFGEGTFVAGDEYRLTLADGMSMPAGNRLARRTAAARARRADKARRRRGYSVIAWKYEAGGR